VLAAFMPLMLVIVAMMIAVVVAFGRYNHAT
jgi:hypothetical protein